MHFSVASFYLALAPASVGLAAPVSPTAPSAASSLAFTLAPRSAAQLPPQYSFACSADSATPQCTSTTKLDAKAKAARKKAPAVPAKVYSGRATYQRQRGLLFPDPFVPAPVQAFRLTLVTSLPCLFQQIMSPTRATAASSSLT